MDISEVAKSSGLPASTLRFYEEKGLINSVGRQGLRRVFHPNVLERLALIALLLVSKADDLDRSIKKLQAMRDGLRHAAVCSAPSHMECAKFLRLLGIAANGGLGGRGKNK